MPSQFAKAFGDALTVSSDLKAAMGRFSCNAKSTRYMDGGPQVGVQMSDD